MYIQSSQPEKKYITKTCQVSKDNNTILFVVLICIMDEYPIFLLFLYITADACLYTSVSYQLFVRINKDPVTKLFQKMNYQLNGNDLGS